MIEEMKRDDRGDEEGLYLDPLFFPFLFGQYEGFSSNHDKHTGYRP
jgi:hypothetical protein